MTGRLLRAGRRLAGSAGLHWPSIRGRARADAGPLMLVASVVTAITLLAGIVPPLIRATADDAARDAFRSAGYSAAVQAHAPWQDDYGPTGGRMRSPRLAEDMDDFRGRAENTLDAGLSSVLQPPVATASSISLAVTDGSVQRRVQLEYLLGDGGGPAVTWIAGGPPRGSAPAAEEFLEIPRNGPPWPVQVGLSEVAAAALGVRPGAAIPLQDEQRNEYNVKVSGVFRPVDSLDPAWRLAPWVLSPVAGVDGLGSTRFGGLLSRESLPDARLAFQPEQLRRTVWFATDPDNLTWDSVQSLAAAVATLKATSASSAEQDDSLRWETQLDSVLRAVRNQVTAATAQASVLLIAVLAAAVLVLLLAADLLARRRAPALIAARQRGASLPDLAVELLIESTAVALPAAALGLALAFVLAGGAALWWAAPVVLCAIAAGPAFGIFTAARATRDRRTPANRSARRWAQRTGQMRRAALDVAVLVAAAGALVALRQRGVGPGGDAALPASAPALLVVAGTLLLLRLMPGATRLALRRSLRSRRPLAGLGAARTAATSARALPLLVLTTATVLAWFALSLDATTGRGLADGAWQTVGADARLDIAPDATTSTSEIAGRIATAPGVGEAVAAQVTDNVRMVADDTSVVPRLVIVDATAFQRLLASTPLPDAPDLARLTGGDGIPALVRTGDGSLRPGMRVRLPGEGGKHFDFTAVGTAPAVGDVADVVIVDTATAAAAGLTAVPNTVWVTGPGAARAVRALAVDAHVEVRADVLHERRTAPLTSSLVNLDRAAAVALLILGLLGFVLGAAASAPQRWETLARLRTLGLRPRDARRVAGTELLPPVLLAAVGGPLLAVLLVRLTAGPLDLHVLTGQATEPGTVIPWWLIGPASVALFATLGAVVAAEAALRRRRRLGDVLRAGNS
jgi:putative ABC transport system permease protein